MKHRAIQAAAALCMLLIICMHTAPAGAWGKYPQFPVIFTIDGEEHLFPCELQAFLLDGWEIYHVPTGDYMASYEQLPGYAEQELTLKRGIEEMDVVIRNNIGHDLEIRDCDVMEIRISEYSFASYIAPDIDIFGIRPGMERSKLPKWLRTQKEFVSDGVRYSVFSSFPDSMMAILDGGYGNGGSIYYSCSEDGRIQYFCIEINEL
ncbi:MAG: hypothetical protein IJB85_02955 [Clostridia bacterium]|nr:hypothetical protein [Clostridia bacterium]